MDRTSFFTKLIGAVGSGVLVAIIMFFVWLANIATRVSVIEETRKAEQLAAKQVDEANKESLTRIEHEREANDARVRDDLRELRQKVFKQNGKE